MMPTFLKNPTKNLAVEPLSNISLNHKNCQRCGGFMITDRCLDVASDTGEVGIAVRRCIQCGDVIDPTIIRNRRLPAGDRHEGPKRRNYPHHILLKSVIEQDKLNQSPTTQTNEVPQ